MNIREDSIVWSGEEFFLKDFLEKFPLPQIVKVEEGYHDEFEEDRTLSSSQLLTLHSIKELATVKATEGSLEVLLPADSNSRVQILNKSDGPAYYDTVEALAIGFPKFAASDQNLPFLNIAANEVLELIKTKQKFRERFLVCQVLETGRTVELPLSFKGRFKVLGDCPTTSPTLKDVIKYWKLPCSVKFMDNKLKLLQDGYDINRPSGFGILGPVKLHSVNHYKVVFTTTWEDQKAHSVLPLPTDLQVRVVAALGAIQGDKNYAKLCKIAQDKTKSDQLVLRFIRHGPCKVIMEDIEEPEEYESPSNYSEVGPRLPPRNYTPGQREQAPVPKPRSISAPSVPPKGLPRPPKEMNDNVFEEYLSVKESGRSRSISLNPEKLPPSFDDNEAEGSHSTAKSPSAFGSESRNRFKDSGKKFGNFFSPLKKVPSKVGSEVKKLRRSVSDLNVSKRLPSSGSDIVGSSAEYREVTPVNATADRLNLEMIEKLKLKPNENPKGKLNIEYPHNIQSWSIRDVGEVLRFCHLDMYVEIFKRETIDGSLLSSLNADALQSLGIQNPLHIQKILKITNGWLPKT
ncbi:uncharacterized protein LOC116294122 [Actinia tenebrosa]|uniref:Uncharacterized protein LOC116294122 n=1 Tax=Actinia tenebrosa TaxID=6105 RepID=A0A6P8HXW5_ACTTE|nr:uncharacterized protein LOC116294122 [Actinia tenebrosa]